MARVIVSDDPVGSRRIHAPLFDEEVSTEILNDPHAAAQVLERMEMAMRDAEFGRARLDGAFAAQPYSAVTGD